MAGDRQIRIAALSACLALVRPVGMTEDETSDWLEVAADTLEDIPAHIVQDGARAARKRCDHHSKIVPTIIEVTRDAVAWHNRPKTAPVLRLVTPKLGEGQPLPDPETLMANLKSFGLSAGFLVQGPDGRLEWATGQESAA
jgi:hypothetical protein